MPALNADNTRDDAPLEFELVLQVDRIKFGTGRFLGWISAYAANKEKSRTSVDSPTF